VPLTIDREYLTKTLVNLVRINSVNPTLVPGGPGEAEIAAFTADSLRDIGMVEVAIHEPEPGRPSVVGALPGHGG
jgi:acetylornithine deacetylase